MATAVYYAALVAMVELMGLPVLVATSIAFALVTIENYLLHRSWTFQSTAAHRSAFPRFVLMSVVGFFLNAGIMYYGVQALQYNYLLVQTLAIVVLVCWNFVLSSLWIFSPVPEQDEY